MAVDEATMGLDLNLQDGGIFRAADRGKGAAAAAATALVCGDRAILGDSGQVRIVAATWPLVTALLAAWSAG